MKENSSKNQADVSRLERIIEASNFQVKSLQDQVDCHKNVEHELQTRIKTIERLEENIQDQERENSRLRTENVQLKNKEKVHVAGKLSGTTPLEIADTIVSLTDAVELINLRLEKHESMLVSPSLPAPLVKSAAKSPPPPFPPSFPAPSVKSTAKPPPPPPPPPPFPPPFPPPVLLPPQCSSIALPTTNGQPKTSSPLSAPPPSTGLDSNNNLSKNTVKQTTMIIADSTPFKIKINQIKDNINVAEEAVIIKRYPGHTAEEMAYYAPKPLHDNKPQQVVIIAGTNSLSRSIHQKGFVDEYEIVEEILDIARAARAENVEKIHVSSILVRRGYPYRDVVSKVNDLLYMCCLVEDFKFMDQSNITMAHIDTDGLHPNYYGSTILKFNILKTFRTFDPNCMTFRSDYENALC